MTSIEAGFSTPMSADIESYKLPKLLSKATSSKSYNMMDNPFRMPTDEELFPIQNQTANIKVDNKSKLRRPKVYEKGGGYRKTFRSLLSEIDREEADLLEDSNAKKDANSLLVSQQLKDRYAGREDLHGFIAKKREMFLLQYSLDVKKNEIRKLEDIIAAEEQKLIDDERSLEEDAAKFDAFLKENDKNSVEAIKKAEFETKAKLEKLSEIKRLNLQILGVRSDMSKNEDQMRDYQQYRLFLDKLTPPEWLAQNRKQRKKKTDDRQAERKATDKSDSAKFKSERHDDASKSSLNSSKSAGKTINFNRRGISTGPTDNNPNVDQLPNSTEAATEEDNFSDDPMDEECALYFTDPKQLLSIFSELEENNLALIQNCQETEETLEELRQKMTSTEETMENETLNLKQQIDYLTAAIKREEERAKHLEEKAKMFSSNLSEESQSIVLGSLNHKVRDVYRKCIGDHESNISTLQMLTSIENRLEQLFEMIELMPQDKVEKAEKMKDKERRHRLREEKLDAQRLLQEERVQRALERARAPMKKKTGKQVVFRSPPPQKKKRKEEATKNKEEGLVLCSNVSILSYLIILTIIFCRGLVLLLDIADRNSNFRF
ncbi:hypothetical protein BKA69DRAFT_373169 [Paraphysoderma sedebokerense]|nr:hypothetical protein BKA69DRAFT_373169 [Paraphysoderma sedebokerense]